MTIRIYKKLLITLLTSLYLNCALGQIILHPQKQNPRLLSEFSKQLNSWNWSGQFQWRSGADSLWNWQIAQSYRSNLLNYAAGANKWKDETSLNAYFYLGKKDLLGGIYTRNWIQSDKQVSKDNRFASHVLGLFTKWNWQKLSFSPYSGYQFSRNRSKVDWGWDVGLNSKLKKYKIGDYTAALEAQADYDLYDKRQNFENNLDLSVATRFNEYSGDSLRFFFSQNSKEYYSGDSIEQVQIYQRQWQNKLFYNISRRDLFVMRSVLESRDISYFNGRSVFALRNSMQYYHLGGRFSYSALLRTSDETQDNSGTLTDSRSRQTAMNFQMDYRFSENRRLNFNLAYIKVEYDTPDSVYNNDDRDEQRFVFNLNYFQRFSPLLTMEWKAYTYLFHQIYIYKEQSQNNNWNRVYKLNPRLTYNYGRVSNRLSTQVLANYTVYDFDYLYAQPKSYIFRKYSLADSLTLRIAGANYLGLQGRLELEDKGSFYKEDFAQQVLQSYQTEFLNVLFSNRRFLYFNLTAGMTFYRRRDWRYLPVKRLNRLVTNQGPYLTLSYNSPQRLLFSAYIAYAQLDDSLNGKSNYFSGHIRLQYTR